jgi:hypothetical protein
MKNSGYLIKTKTGKLGRTFHSKGMINNKLPVYLEADNNNYNQNAILCDPKTVKVIGFID